MKKGSNHSKEAIDKIRLSFTKERREELRKAMIGKTFMAGKSHTAETKRKMREAAMGTKNHNYGMKMTKSTRDKISEATKGEKSHNWKGGITTYARKLWFNRQRRVIKLGNGGAHTQGEWEILKAQYNWTCLACKKVETEITLTVDHVIPLSRGGSDNIENVQPLCRSCNAKKHTNITNYKILL